MRVASIWVTVLVCREVPPFRSGSYCPDRFFSFPGHELPYFDHGKSSVRTTSGRCVTSANSTQFDSTGNSSCKTFVPRPHHRPATRKPMAPSPTRHSTFRQKREWNSRSRNGVPGRVARSTPRWRVRRRKSFLSHRSAFPSRHGSLPPTTGPLKGHNHDSNSL